jgi:hypothetical protein
MVRLHETRVNDSIVGRMDAHAALTLLHHNGKDKARVNGSRHRKRLNSTVNIIDFGHGIIGAPAIPAT